MIDHFNVSHLGLHGHRALVVSRWMDQLFILVMHHVQLLSCTCTLHICLLHQYYVVLYYC